MIIEDKLKELIELKSGSLRAFAADNDIPYTTLRSILERGVLNAKMDNILKICKGLGISPEELANFGNSKITHLEDKRITLASKYNFYDTGLSAGVLDYVNSYTPDNTKTIELSDVIMGKYAGDKDIFITYVNGDSMNHIIPDGTLIAVKRYDSFYDLCDGDIVVFQDESSMAVKRFYNDDLNGIITFKPDSIDDRFKPINYLYDNMNNVKIIGKVVVYAVTI